MISDATLPIIFVGLMGLAVLLYAILDGYDLGVGILLPLGHESRKDQMIASIGPFWDANETWLVLAVGLLLIAFPSAHSLVLRELYLPATFMLFGLIMRGVAFDFRAKVAFTKKALWDKVFKFGSILTAFMQGVMLGSYIMGFEHSLAATLFSLLSGIGVTAAYAFIGACWLVMKTDGELQIKAVYWARKTSWMCFAGVLAVCLVNPLINPGVLDRWISLPFALFIWPIPFVCFCLFVLCHLVLKRLPLADDAGCWVPFMIALFIFLFCFQGLAVSFFPYIVPGQLDIWQAASAPESLRFILVGAIVVVPCILAYTAFSYRVFWGKVRDLRYY
ncbi:cytochrome d ubiquinol oxidase subunit II [Aliiglaciecola sp. CAU 1673]|uniref:cytochrome d ubiquinol oxidase subunit II n=1 Tax=Aliiglaciecola sp. CAU 1673 TaxID=3032595 RepID=UPI0023DA608E|nr:cytochrome d ubiquinol oxidase subunit II [Aliiglaciecola sp. CAU 1673]MDF2176725.1 cytochrome d ubiquinol oxidase subunit II [Aliiglaciecola sp. CAU 1673]